MADSLLDTLHRTIAAGRRVLARPRPQTATVTPEPETPPPAPPSERPQGTPPSSPGRQTERG